MHRYRRRLFLGLVLSMAHGLACGTDAAKSAPGQGELREVPWSGRLPAQGESSPWVNSAPGRVTPQDEVSPWVKSTPRGTVEFLVPKTMSYKGLPSQAQTSETYIRFAPDSRQEPAVKKLFGELYTLDQRLLTWSDRRPENLSDAQFRSVIDARNIVAIDLAEGVKSGRTRFPEEKRRQVEDILTAISMGVASASPRDQVKTVISYAGRGANVVVHYRKVVDDAASWSTYAASQIMRVGTYQFRVSSMRAIARIQPCVETVLVMNDPTEKSICGGYQP